MKASEKVLTNRATEQAPPQPPNEPALSPPASTTNMTALPSAIGPRTAITGYVDHLTTTAIKGWSLDRLDLSRRLTARAEYNGQTIATSDCTIFRDDLQKSGAGDGCYGFSISLDPQYAPNIDQIMIVIADTEPTYTLPLSPQARVERQASPLQPAINSNLAQTRPIDIVFDVSDLIQYFRNSGANLEMRLPTGIQRVQIEIITGLIFNAPSDVVLRIAAFSEKSDTWIEIQPLFFNHICKLSLVGSSAHDIDWKQGLAELELQIAKANKLIFPNGAYLINLGTSWWLQNYFLHIRAAKQKYNIKYVPFIHDCIPIMVPEHCTVEVTQNFISWLQGVFYHADHFMANSNASASDLQRAGKYLGFDVTKPSIVPLDGDYKNAINQLKHAELQIDDTDIFVKNGFRRGRYVLLVSTIESRKNHLQAFGVWLKIIKRHGLSKVPHLVCVGKKGWLNHAIYALLESSELLQQRVIMLSNISDPALEQLYQNCLFSLYPSSYEGWGLPVTESLSYGKVPLIARNSSLPEAGGQFADYVEPGSEVDLLQKSEQLIFDHPYRQSREAKIATEFHPRPWTEIANQVLEHVRNWVTETKRDNSLANWLFNAEPGQYYGITSNQERLLSSNMVSGELFRLGSGWWGPEPWGCWTKPQGGRLACLFHNPENKAMILFLGIRGVQGKRSNASITLEEVGGRVVPLQADQGQWVIFRLSGETVTKLPRVNEAVLLELVCNADQSADFGVSTEGQDPRIASLSVQDLVICRDDDVQSRLRLAESGALGDLAGLRSYAGPTNEEL